MQEESSGAFKEGLVTAIKILPSSQANQIMQLDLGHEWMPKKGLSENWSKHELPEAESSLIRHNVGTRWSAEASSVI